MSKITIQPDDRLIDIKEVASISGVGRATIYRRMKAQEFPLCARIGPGSVRWLESEVRAWIVQKLGTRHA